MDNILVIKLGALGDFIQATGPMKAIRMHHRDARIVLLTTKAFEGLARDCGYFDDIWLDSRPRWINLRGWLGLRRRLNSGSFTRVYDLQNSDRSGFYLRLFSPKPEWVGAALGASHRNASPERVAGHAFDGHVQTLKLAGIGNVDIDRLDWVKADVAGFALQSPYALIVPGSAPGKPGKRWPAGHYAELCQRLAAEGIQPVLLGTQTDGDTTGAIAAQCPGVLNLTGQTSLKQIVVLARNAACAVGNDTGPMHMIAATGCPCVSLFSDNSNRFRHYPKGPVVEVLHRPALVELPVGEVLEAVGRSVRKTDR